MNLKSSVQVGLFSRHRAQAGTQAVGRLTGQGCPTPSVLQDRKRREQAL